MANLDRRLDPTQALSANKEAGVKDGPSGQPTNTAPKKEDAEEKNLQKAPDVVHSGRKES